MATMTPPVARPGMGRKCSSISNLIDAYASAGYSNAPSPGAALPASSSTTLDTMVIPSPRKDSGFSDSIPWIQTQSVNNQDASESDLETASPSKSQTRRIAMPKGNEKSPLLSTGSKAQFDTKEVLFQPTYSVTSASVTPGLSRPTYTISDQTVPSVMSVYNTKDDVNPLPYVPASSSPSTTKQAMRPSMSPLTSSSPRGVSSARDISSPRLPHESVLASSSVLRPAISSTTQLGSDHDHSASPTRKLVRKQSSGRMRKDSGTSGHARSLSLPRTATCTAYTTTAPSSNSDHDESGRPTWLDQDPTLALRKGSLDEGRPRYPTPGLPDDNASSDKLRRKPSFYRRIRSQTANHLTSHNDTNGFPMPSPMSEVIKAMPSAGGPAKRSHSSGLLSSLTRKLSSSNLGHSHTFPQHETVPPLPTNSDYFGTAVAAEAEHSALPRQQPATIQPQHHTGQAAPSPSFVHQGFTDPFSSSLVTTTIGAATLDECSYPGRSVRSQSAPSPMRPMRSTSIKDGQYKLSRTPVPPMPATYQSFGDGTTADLVISRREADPFQRPSSGPATPQGNSSGHTSARRPSNPQASAPPSAAKTPLSPPHRSFEHARPPPSPDFRRTTRANSTSSKTTEAGVPEESNREARFLELLTKSDKSRNGVIKLSLTSKSAQNVGIA